MDKISIDELLRGAEKKIDRLLDQKKEVEVTDDNTSIIYEVLQTEEELLVFLDKMQLHEAELMRIGMQRGGVTMEPFDHFGIVNFIIKNNPRLELAINNCSNLIFLKKVFLNQYNEIQYLNFSQCKFKSYVSLGKSRLEEHQRLIFDKCTFNQYLVLNGNIDFVDFKNSEFLNPMSLTMHSVKCKSFQARNTELSFSMQNSEVEKISLSNCNIKHCHIFNVSTEKKLVISGCSIKDDGSFRFNDYILNGYGKINFSELSGKLTFNDTVFHNLSFDFETLKQSNFKAIQVITGGELDPIRTAYNFKVLYDVAKESNDNKNYLMFELMENNLKIKNQRLQIKQLKHYYKYIYWALSKLYAISFAHFCSWTRLLVTILVFIFTFSLVYTCNPDKILSKGKPLYNGTIIEALSNTGISGVLGIFADCLYFSAITFTTVGYGDISPDHMGFIKYIVGLEGLIGVTLIAFLSVTIVRRFAK